MSDDGRRRARRAFLLTHHPDRGGDTSVFVAGLAAFDADQHPGAPGRVHVVHRPRGAVGWWRCLVAAARRRAHPSPPRVH